MRDDVSLSGIEPELQEDGPGRGSRSFRFPRTHGRKPDFPVALDHRNSGSRGHGVRERSGHGQDPVHRHGCAGEHRTGADHLPDHRHPAGRDRARTVRGLVRLRRAL